MKKNFKTCHVERQNIRTWTVALKTNCCQHPWDLKSGLEALLAEMYDLREVLSLVRAYTIKRRKIKLMLKRKAQFHFKIAFWKRCWESCPLAQLEYYRINTPLHIQKQVILHCRGERLFCYNHWSLKYVLTRSFGSNSLNNVWFVKMQNIFCHFFHSNKILLTYLDPTAFLL